MTRKQTASGYRSARQMLAKRSMYSSAQFMLLNLSRYIPQQNTSIKSVFGPYVIFPEHLIFINFSRVFVSCGFAASLSGKSTFFNESV